MALNTLEELIIILDTNSQQVEHFLRYPDKYYSKGQELKKDGLGIREFDKPNLVLKKIQTQIYEKFLKHYPLSPLYHGYISKKSPITNAKVHVKQPKILKADIKNFFPSINSDMILKVFLNLGFNNELAGILTKLTTFNSYLPQGAPTSPFLSNIILKPLVRKLERWSYKNRFKITIYADDISISGSDINNKHKEDLKKLINNFGFQLKEEKTDIFYPEREQVKITGIVVGKKLSLPKKEIRNLKAIIHNCILKGPSTQSRTRTIEKFKSHLTGKIDRLKQIESANISNNKTIERIINDFKIIDWNK